MLRVINASSDDPTTFDCEPRVPETRGRGLSPARERRTVDAGGKDQVSARRRAERRLQTNAFNPEKLETRRPFAALPPKQRGAGLQ